MQMKGDFKVVFFPDRVSGRASTYTRRFLTLMGAEYTNYVKALMRDSPRSGRNKNSRGQQRSGPGEAPASEFGDLIRSVKFFVRETPIGWVMEAGSTLKKAVYLEFGAARGKISRARDMSGRFTKAVTMQWILYPRPSWGPALLWLRRQVPRISKSVSK